MGEIEVKVKIDTKVQVPVSIDELIEGINDVPMTKRWHYIAKIINEVEVDIVHMTDEQKEIIKNYLTEKLLLF